MSEYVRASEALGHLMIKPLKEGFLPVEALIVLKCIDPDGDSTWVQCTTEKINQMEVIGALSAMHSQQLADFNSHWEFDEDDE